MSRSATAIVFCLLLFGCSQAGDGASNVVVGRPMGARITTTGPVSGGLGRVQHVVVLMLENRSFDSYFGTFPGVNGIPPNPNCNPDPQTQQCILPFHNTSLINYGGPHSTSAMWGDIDGGKFDGFIIQAEQQPKYIDPSPDDVMGYHTCAEIPVYCQYASEYTIADNHFAATNSWSAIAHLYLVSGWSAKCTSPDPMSCTSSNNTNPYVDELAWTDITWLLHSHGISWKYYMYGKGGNSLGPRTFNGDDGEDPGPNVFSPSAWNPLPGFDDVRTDGELGNIVAGDNFLADAKAGTLQAVSWVIPPFLRSDHPAEPISGGQDWVRHQIGAVMKGPDANSTLILVTWDEWGGFYDHVMPPVIDVGGYGFRTPLIIVGSMVKHGYVDHQLLTSDAYLKLIEDLFLGSARLDPNTDGRPDPRSDVRENVTGLGDLRNDLVP
jgi:phospholipase C